MSDITPRSTRQPYAYPDIAELKRKARRAQRIYELLLCAFVVLLLFIARCAFGAEPPKTVEYGRTCMALAIYAEARSEGYDGQAAVGKVILNRVHSGMASSICDAVQAYGQFKGIADWPYPRVPHESAAWHFAQRVTEDVITERYILAPENCENALYFRSGDAPLPINATKECRIGQHRFFQLAPQVGIWRSELYAACWIG